MGTGKQKVKLGAGCEKVDTVRASRDGHEFHEIWVARRALQLLWADSELSAVAVEGLSPKETTKSSSSTEEIADMVLYYGGFSFIKAERTVVAQFKYSVAAADKPFRASDAKNTLRKFAKAFREHREQHGAQVVHNKLEFHYVSNRPVFEELERARASIADGASMSDDEQTKQFKTATGLTGTLLMEFAQICSFLGSLSDLPTSKRKLASLLVDWSSGTDLLATARLGQLCALARDKAGTEGQHDNLITRPDVLVALNVHDSTALLPCPTALIDVGPIIEREQLAAAESLVLSSHRPLLVHAPGGAGKTVFLQSLASTLGETELVVFFDCFGGGAYRSPHDARHRSHIGFVHIGNLLAFRGLCEPLLPGTPDEYMALGAFRSRLKQSVETLRRQTPGRSLVIVLDAIDNAEIAAKRWNERPFPQMLMESLHDAPIAGAQLIVSCRSERKPKTHARCNDLELQPFTPQETARFVRARLSDATAVVVGIAHARSGGNPRVLDYLLQTHGLEESQFHGSIALDDLIKARIERALDAAELRGWEEAQLQVFLGALVSLPPPVPIQEHAGAAGVDNSAVESFASDLSPLLERTSQGLLFRDEPTETYVIEHFGSSDSVLRELSKNLSARQEESVYAAESLPGILYELGDGDQLFTLAFDPRLPLSVRSTVGRRNIRRARLCAAARYAAAGKDFSKLSELLLELSTVAAGTQRGARYISQSPDLVAASQDVDVIRRLHETGRGWPGSRHARRAIVNTILGNQEEASRNFAATQEWTIHYRRTERSTLGNKARPEHPDHAAAPFYLVSVGQSHRAAKLLSEWHDWYAFELSQHIINFLFVAKQLRPESAVPVELLMKETTQLGPLAAFLAFSNPKPNEQIRLVSLLAKRCRSSTKTQFDEGHERGRTRSLADGLRKAAGIALSLERPNDARSISLRAPHGRVNLWFFNRTFDHHPIFAFMFRLAVVASDRGNSIHERDMLPIDIYEACRSIPKTTSGNDFRIAAKGAITKALQKKQLPGIEKARNRLSREDEYRAGKFVDHYLAPLLLLTRKLSEVLSARQPEVDTAYTGLLECWREARRNETPARDDERSDFFWSLGYKVVVFALWTRADLSLDSAQRFVEAVDSIRTSAHDLLQAVAAIADRPSLSPVTAELAALSKEQIDLEHDVEHRASLLTELARSLLPTNIDEADAYFRVGLEQMDAIGSGDYWYTAGLLRYAGVVPGEQLVEEEVHTLSNICELNLGDEPHKFYWSTFGSAFGRVADARILAKLSRWDDRNTASFDCTLLPFLGALLRESKLMPGVAVALNYLASPYEHRGAGTAEFARDLATTTPSTTEVAELIAQYEMNTPELDIEGATAALEQLACEYLHAPEATVMYLRSAREREKENWNVRNQRGNYSRPIPGMAQNRRRRSSKHDPLKNVIKETNPCDVTALRAAVETVGLYEQKNRLFEGLREKVPFDKRSSYLRAVVQLDNLYVHWKLGELLEAKRAWERTSLSLQSTCEELTTLFLEQHLSDVLDDNGFSHSMLLKLSEFCAVRPAEIALLVVQRLTQYDIYAEGEEWLALAYYVTTESKPPHALNALSRLLGSDAASLSSNTADGAWQANLYPDANASDIVAGAIWRSLGAAEAEDRWRAAHSMLACGRLGHWEILDCLVSRLEDEDAGPYQATELPFFALHARLWCLIALARIALSHPSEVCRYKARLLAVIKDTTANHVLLRYFAAQALLSCADQETRPLSEEALSYLRTIGTSTKPAVIESRVPGGGFYDRRPESAPEPKHRFILKYQFHKCDVDRLARVFGKGCWEIEDLVAEAAAAIAPEIESMHDAGGRASRTEYGMISERHTYGEMVGWHALLFAASKLLATCPETISRFGDENRWQEWFEQFGLTRDDGYWLSDATDRIPIDIRVFLLEQKKKGLVLTGKKDRLCQLVGTEQGELVVEGTWYSADKVRVRLSSALAPIKTADELARKLTLEQPGLAWLPRYSKDRGGEEYLMDDHDDFEPWVVDPSCESLLDEHDPFGSPEAYQRPHLSAGIQELLCLTTDPFMREWKDREGEICARTEAWGRKRRERGDGTAGSRLLINQKTLRKLLKKKEMSLLILIELERTERLGRNKDRYSRTVAVLRIRPDGGTKYFKGYVNHSREY